MLTSRSRCSFPCAEQTTELDNVCGPTPLHEPHDLFEMRAERRALMKATTTCTGLLTITCHTMPCYQKTFSTHPIHSHETLYNRKPRMTDGKLTTSRIRLFVMISDTQRTPAGATVHFTTRSTTHRPCTHPCVPTHMSCTIVTRCPRFIHCGTLGPTYTTHG